MSLNRIQIAIFDRLSTEKSMSPDEYVRNFSQQYLCKEVGSVSALTEEEADRWITKAYLDSLEQQ